MLTCDCEKTVLLAGDVLYISGSTIGLSREGKRVLFLQDAISKREDDKFFYEALDTPSFQELAECIGGLLSFQVAPGHIEGRSWQFLPLDRGEPQNPQVRDRDVIVYRRNDGHTSFLRTQTVVRGAFLSCVSAFFCFAKLLGILSGREIRIFHQTKEEIGLQFVGRCGMQPEKGGAL